MDLAYMKQMNEEGATLVVLGVPEGTEFGIDMQSWAVGHKFKGIRMIPPGLHFIYFSAVSKQGDTAPRTGFFHYFELNEVLVKKYSLVDEDLYDVDEKTVERVKLNLDEINRGLGPFPLDSWTKWISFTQHIDKASLERMVPLSGKICSAPELINKITKYNKKTTEISSDEKKDKEEELENKECNEKNHEEGEGVQENESSTLNDCKLPSMITKPGTEIRFTKFPTKPYKDGASPAEISRGNIDSSYTVDFILQKLEKPESIISELQFSFICFILGQVWDSWEHWRSLVMALCKAEETLIAHPSLYSDFISVLHYQIQEVPEDLFADIVESNNFLVMSLRTFFANVCDNKYSLPPKLVSKAGKFRGHLVSKFKWNLELEEEDEELPVVVEC